MIRLYFVVGAIFALSVSATHAQEIDPGVELYGGLGVAVLRGNEYVYDGTGSPDRISALYWDSTAPVLSVGMSVDLPKGWVFGLDAQVGMSGDSHMVDYDWLTPNRTSFAADQWTDRSIHPDTKLDWYFNGSAKLGYNLIDGDSGTVQINAGFRYIDVSWDGINGTAIYSKGGFRNTVEDFSGQRVISYRQQLPLGFIGVNTQFDVDNVTLAFGAQGGLTVGAKDDDIHWLNNDRFLGTGFTSAAFHLDAKATYHLNEQTDLFVAGTVDHIVDTRADTQVVKNSTGLPSSSSNDAAGFGFTGVSLTAGLLGHF